MMATNRDTLNWYVGFLEETLTSNDILGKPSQIFNCDKTGIPLDDTSRKVLTVRDSKHSLSGHNRN
jgi:hypothetical protein